VYVLRVKKSNAICLILIIIIAIISIMLLLQNMNVVFIDKDYLNALNTADKYLYAWIMRDSSIAYDLISDNIKKNYADEKDFQMHFAGVSNPHHQAFEITGYKRLSNDRVSFKVWYYEDYTGIYEPPYKRPKPSYLELIKIDKDTWLVNEPTIVKGMTTASTHNEKNYIKDSFFQSVNYNPNKGLLSFTIPKTVPEDYRFYLHISGRKFMGNKPNGMSFHAFDKESQNNSWEMGKTYTYSVKSENLDECLLVFGLINKNNQKFLYAIHILPDGAKNIESTY
jgi:hypothetical protein